MKIPEISFSIDHYDCEGDTIETGIYLHFDHTRIRVAEDLGELNEFIKTIIRIEEEIHDNYLILEEQPGE